EIAKASKLATVAEGVETQAQLERVQALGVDFIQGYFFARPMDPDEALFLAKEDCALKVT
ncbi:Diguanylate phosphodiesterase, predicted domain protein, partial [mine drainage metagenome]